MSDLSVLQALTAVPGLIALAGALIGYGRAMQRIVDLEKVVIGADGHSGLVGKIETLTETVTKTREDLSESIGEVREDVAGVKAETASIQRELGGVADGVRRLTDRLLDGRSGPRTRN